MKSRICSTSDVPERTMRAFEVSGERVLVARVRGEYFAVCDTCSHFQQSLSTGMLDIERLAVECPLHRAVFDLKSGEVIEGPATEPVRAYRVEVHGEDIYVEPAAV